MSKFAATPTEYKGIRFRSKSEAMFALWLDLDSEERVSIYDSQRRNGCGFICVNEGMSVWKYEPQLIFAADFSIDFLVCRINTGIASLAPFMDYEFIEYKPSMPTKTYIERYFDKYHQAMDCCERELGLYEISRRSSAVIAIGSVYTSDRHWITSDGFGGYQYEDYDWLVNYEDAIRNYRFDLEVQHASH